MNVVIIFFAQYLPFALVGIALWFMLRFEILKRKSALALLVLASAFAFVIDKILNQLISSPRPFVVEGINPLFSHAVDNGFPSEHVLFAMVIAGVIFVYNRKLGIILGILAIMIGIARIVAYVHHPIDVLGGIAIALVSVFSAWHLLSRPKIQSVLGIKSSKTPLF